jgi:hypothetical protein
MEFRATRRPYNLDMRRLGLAVLVLVGSLAAQNAPPPTAPEAPPVPPPQTSPSQVCVTPLPKAKVGDASRFSLRVIVKPDSLDPKIVLKPALPSCGENGGASNNGPGDHPEAPKQ